MFYHYFIKFSFFTIPYKRETAKVLGVQEYPDEDEAEQVAVNKSQLGGFVLNSKFIFNKFIKMLTSNQQVSISYLQENLF